MRTPICNICLKSRILCQGCESRLKDGKISELELNISRILFELAQKHRGLNEVNFKRAVDGDGLTALVVGRGEISLVVGRGGKVARKLEQYLNTKIRVVEESAEARKMVQDLLTPAKVLGINILYTKGGEEHRVRVLRSHARRLPASIDAIQNLLSKLTNKSIKLVFE